jgi:NAD+ diphosphatase
VRPPIASHQRMRLGFCWTLSAAVMTLAMQPLAIATQSFAANPLFRGCKAKDPAFLAAALHDGRALLVKGQTVAMQGDELVWVAVNSIAAATVDCYLLGQMQSEGWHAFTVDVSAAPELAAQHSFVNIRKLLAGSSNLATVALAGQATALASWHASCKFCGGCGQPTAAIEAGLKRACSACKRRFYPRTDPCVNVLVVSPDGQKILLGRRAGTAPATKGGGVYSNLAGFVEQGESVEECAGEHILQLCIYSNSIATLYSKHHCMSCWQQ